MILDTLIQRDYALRIAQMQEALRGQLFQNELYPYLLSLWLTELSQSCERTALERYGVGGVFHFIFQAERSEHTQKPAFYVLCDADVTSKRLYLWQYRVCFVQEWLVIDTLVPPNQLTDAPQGRQERVALLDECSLPPSESGSWDANTLYANLRTRIEDELGKQPLYFFAGFGYANPMYRKGFGFQVTTKGDYVLTPDGQLRADVLDLILQDIAEVSEQ